MLKILSILFIFYSCTLIALNHLASETSPYLLQHKNNPVDWYAWGDKAFDVAKKENKLIFVSIGYSTCHWCHVMAHESFEDEKVAKILNDNYISIKIDKEQFPHIDRYYQGIYRLMNQKSGGWPLTIILTPDKKPFFSATYIPKYRGYGSAGLIDTLTQISLAPQKELQKIGDEVLRVVKLNEDKEYKVVDIDTKLETKSIEQFNSSYDHKNKGFSISPKFPNSSSIVTLLKLYEITKDKKALDMATSALDAMARGGIYDQIDGAFYRYSVDSRWEMPHFEKMLYTNAQLIKAYTKAYIITKKPLYKKVVSQTIKEMDRRFRVDNLYMSASNADSKNFDGKNEEGFFFIYDYYECEEYLEELGVSKKDIEESLHYLGILKDGNYDGDYSNPRIIGDKEPASLSSVKNLLKKYREKKEYPFIDNKINTAWNSLYIESKFIASAIDPSYVKDAKKSIDALLKLMSDKSGLYHQTIKGIKPTQKGLLEDYAFLAAALFEAYETTLDVRYMKQFKRVVESSIIKFYKDERWMESVDGFKTFATIDDRGYASSLSVNLINLLKYSTIDANSKVYAIAKKTIDRFSAQIAISSAYSPTALEASLMLKYPAVFIKSNKKNLQKLNLEEIKYPFLYLYVTEDKNYLACKQDSCFSYTKDIEKLKKDIKRVR